MWKHRGQLDKTLDQLNGTGGDVRETLAQNMKRRDFAEKKRKITTEEFEFVFGYDVMRGIVTVGLPEPFQIETSQPRVEMDVGNFVWFKDGGEIACLLPRAGNARFANVGV
jgi:hypothetical protein